MPKRVLDLRDFSGGINSRINKTELNDNEVTKSVGLMYDVPGIIRGMGETTVLKYDETNVVPTLSSQTNYTVGPENGYGLGFVSFDAPSQIYVIQTGEDISALTIGNYLSNSNNDDWNTTVNNFVLQIFAIDNTDDGYGARQIFCYVIKPGKDSTSLFAVAKGIETSDKTLYESANADGTNRTGRTNIWSDTGFINLLNTNNHQLDAPNDWQFHKPNPNWTQPWTITGGELVLTTANNFAPGCAAYLGTFETPGITSGKLYRLTLDFSANLTGGDIIISLNGQNTIISPTGASSISVVIRAGNVEYPSVLGGLWLITPGLAGITATITDVTLVLHPAQYGTLNNLNASTTSQNALIYTDSYDQKVKYFSYEMGAFGDILVDSATDGNLKEALVLKDDNGSVTSEISPIIYSIEGAIRLIEANFKSLKKGTSTARAPFESKYLTYIDRKYFNDRIQYLEWIAEPADIDEPTNGVVKFDGSPLYTNQMENGFINMLAYKGEASKNRKLFKEFIGVDGCYSGHKEEQHEKQHFPIVASKWNVITNGTEPIPPLPDGSPAKGCVGFFKTDRQQNSITFQYHSGLDGTLGPTEAFDKAVDLTSSDSGALLVTLYISPNALTNLVEENPLTIYIGNSGDAPGDTGAEFGETFDGNFDDGANVAFAYYDYPKTQLESGWTTFKLEKNKYTGLRGAYDAKNIKDVFVRFRSKETSLYYESSQGNYNSYYYFYFVGSDGGGESGPTNSQNYDDSSYYNMTFKLGEGNSQTNPLVRYIRLNKDDFYTITSVSYPDGTFTGSGNAKYYRNKAIIGVQSKTPSAITVSSHFQQGDLILVKKDGITDSSYTSYTSNKENYFCACVDSVSDSDNTITVTLPLQKGEILGTKISDSWFDITEFDNNARLYKNPNLPDSGNQTAPIEFYTSDTSSTGIGENYSFNPVPFAISTIEYEKAVQGNWNGKYTFYYSFVYDDKQESKMYEFKSLSNKFGDGTLPSNEIELKEEMLYLSFCLKEASITGGWNHATAGRKRISGANIYYSKILEDAETGDTSYYFLGELDLNKGFRLSGTTKYNLFQEVNAGSFENSSLVCAAGDIKYATGTNDTITSVSELDFSKFFKVGDRIKIVTETTALTGATLTNNGYEREVTIKSIASNILTVNEEIYGSSATSGESATFTFMGVYDSFKAIVSAEPVKSTATLTFTGAPSNGELLTLFDADNNTVAFKIASNTTLTGDVIGGGDTSINVGTSGLSTAKEIADALAKVINNVTSFNNSQTLHITADSNQATDGQIVLTQDIAGPTGDNVIYHNMSNLTADAGFTGNTKAPVDYNDLKPLQIETPPMVEIFETRALYRNDVEYTSARYKTHTINNGVVYAGNVMQGDVIYPDRILKSLPSRPDLFPSDNFIEAAVNDGDEIIVLESFNDRILQFKRGSLSIINVAGSIEYLENTYQHLGVKSVMAVYKTDKGVIFANKSGVYIFIGEGEPTKLTSKLSDSDWKAFVNGEPEKLALLYVPLKDQIMVGHTTTDDAYILDLRTQSISFGEDVFLFGSQTTNIVTDTVNNQPVYLSKDGSNNLKFYTMYNSEDDTYLASITHGTSTVATSSDIQSTTGIGVEFKHLDFGAPEVRKKIHSITITSKDSDGDLKLQYSSNMGNSWVDVGVITNYDGNRGSYSRQKFKVSINNIYTLGLRIVPNGTANIEADFGIQDISIVYRMKNVK
jgi:hypothetical protein